MPLLVVIFLGSFENSQHVLASRFIKNNDKNEGRCWWPYKKHDNPPEISIHFSSAQINKMIIKESMANNFDGTY